MKNLLFFFILTYLISGCKNPFLEPRVYDPGFKIINNSSKDIEWIKIYAEDIQRFYKPDTIKINSILLFDGKINAKDSLMMVKRDLRQYSKTGEGNIIIFAKKKDSKDTLSQHLGRYMNNEIFRDSFVGFNAFKVLLIDKNSQPTPYQDSELIVRFAKYKGEIQIK
jgi:hypothetical protein